MERLTKAQVELVKKLSTARLISKLTSVGYTDEELDIMDREALLQAWATCIAEGKDKPPASVNLGYDVKLERQKLEFEKLKFEKDHELEKLKIESEKLKVESDEKLKKAELKLREQKYAAEREKRDSVVSRAKRYGDAIKASLTVMGPEPLEDVLFFRHIEAIFDRYKVPTDLQAALLQPYLDAKARSIVARMDSTSYHNYKAVRDVILKEHKLSPRSYLDLFNSLARSQVETCVMYCAKLRSLLNMYVESRKVEDFEALMSLLVCDRVKSVLSEGCLRHVLSVEATATDGWLSVDKLAEAVDLYSSNHLANDRPRASALGLS